MTDVVVESIPPPTVIPLRGEVVTSKADKNIERLLLTVRGGGLSKKKDYGWDMLIDPR